MSEKKALKKAYKEAQEVYIRANNVANERYKTYMELESKARMAESLYEEASDTASNISIIVDMLEEILYP